MNTRFITNALRNYPVTLSDGRSGYIAPVQWSDVSCATTGAHIGSIGTQPNMIRIRLSSYHLTVVPLGDINTINGKDVVSAINEAGDDHFKLVELLR